MYPMGTSQARIMEQIKHAGAAGVGDCLPVCCPLPGLPAVSDTTVVDHVSTILSFTASTLTYSWRSQDQTIASSMNLYKCNYMTQQHKCPSSPTLQLLAIAQVQPDRCTDTA